MSLLQRMVRRLYPHGATRTVLCGPLRGMKFRVINGMGATYALGVDFMNLKFLGPRLRPGMVVYDVGGNCGQMALFFSRFVGPSGRVITFEPVPENFARLCGNLQLNILTNVEALETAVGADQETKSFCYDTSHHTMGTFTDSMVKLHTWEKTITVPCTTLDAAWQAGRPAPDMIKIDVEGAGGAVIQGATRLITENLPGIYFEIHAADKDAPELQALRLLRERWRYEITDLNGTLQDQFGPMWGAAVWCEPPAT
jgi:FkbM family methyltransferase